MLLSSTVYHVSKYIEGNLRDVPTVVGSGRASPHSNKIAPTQAKITTIFNHNQIKIHFPHTHPKYPVCFSPHY